MTTQADRMINEPEIKIEDNSTGEDSPIGVLLFAMFVGLPVMITVVWLAITWIVFIASLFNWNF